ncbi:MAG: choice-of-anchor L domain-containing protein [Paracoccaceae bacterium]
MAMASKLQVDTKASANDMAETIFGSGVKIITASYSGAGRASGTFENGDEVAPDITPSDTGVILSTGRATAVTNSNGDANSKSNTTTKNHTKGDDDLEQMAGVKTYDAAVFESTFVPQGSTLTMQVTFSSEEYLEYVGSGFNDAVGIWVNGAPAKLTVGDGDITINNINDEENENLYIDNPADDEVANTEMDGFTVKLTLKATVTPGQENTIKIAIADGGDSSYDSNLLIAGDSIQTALIAQDNSLELSGEAPSTLDVLANDVSVVSNSLTITHINGQPVSAGDSVTLSSGETVTLNADGTFEVTSDGDDGTSVFSYTVQDGHENTDTAFVTVTTTPQVACFVAGTLIETASGPLPIEQLVLGQLIQTRDNGFQPLRWIGRTLHRATGKCAPVLVEQNALGTHGQIFFSSNHRVLIQSHRAQLFYGADEVLVKIANLINGTTVRVRDDGSETPYFHLLFDHHEIVTGNGLQSESYHPGADNCMGFDTETRNDFLDILPGLSWASTIKAKPTARPVLRTYETQLLFAS